MDRPVTNASRLHPGWQVSLPLLICSLLFVPGLLAQTPAQGPTAPPIQVGGAFPQISVVAGAANRSEAGVGALLPWADRLWFVAYVAHA